MTRATLPAARAGPWTKTAPRRTGRRRKRTAEAKGTARARFFGGIMETRSVIVEPDGDVLVWDRIAGYYTRCHGLSRRSQRRIARLVRNGHSERA